MTNECNINLSFIVEIKICMHCMAPLGISYTSICANKDDDYY